MKELILQGKYKREAPNILPQDCTIMTTKQ